MTRFLLAASLYTVLGFLHLAGQVVSVSDTPQIGSPNPATAELLVSRPKTKQCTVQLIENLEFADFSAKTFAFTPPSGCPGPWAKVVFTADFTVTAGRSVRPYSRVLSWPRQYLLRDHRRAEQSCEAVVAY